MVFRNKNDIDDFFKKLSKLVNEEINIYLLGGCALLLLGGQRTTHDIDLEIKDANEETFEKIQQFCIDENIPINFSEDVSKWGMISISSDRNTSLPYNKFGKINVRILDPIDMSIGKIERFIDTDIQDVVFLVKKFSIKSEELLAAWAKALKASIKSEKTILFRKQVESFIKTYSINLWNIENTKLLNLWDTFYQKK